MYLQLRALRRAEAIEISGWRYDPPYDTYIVSAEDAEVMTDPAQRFSSLYDREELIAYACLGAEARVNGMGPEPGTEDLGFGLRPDLMGRGLSREFLPWLLDAIANQIPEDCDRLRVAILDWNARSLGAYRRAGFTDISSLTNDAGTFLLLTRPSFGHRSEPARL